MLAAFCWYTTVVVCLNIVVIGGGSNLFPLEQISTFSQDEIKERIKGSKVVIISEQAMLNTIYFLKACMLIMYTRLTMGLRQQKMVKAIAVYVGCGWVGTELAFFFACRPFKGYWAVPPPNPQCTTLEHYAITQATFNISSDLLMLFIMLPLLLQSNLPVKQKAALIVIFSMGSFVIVAAILTKVFNLSDVYSTVYMLWYVREASTAMYVANLPMIWPLLREWFPCLSQITSIHRSTANNRKTGTTANSTRGRRRSAANGTIDSISMSQLSKSKSGQYIVGTATDIERTSSAERINKPPFEGRGILAETTVDIDFDDTDEGTSSVDDGHSEKHGHVHALRHRQDRPPPEWESSWISPKTGTEASSIETKTAAAAAAAAAAAETGPVRDVNEKGGRPTPRGHGPAEEMPFIGQAV